MLAAMSRSDLREDLGYRGVRNVGNVRRSMDIERIARRCVP